MDLHHVEFQILARPIELTILNLVPICSRPKAHNFEFTFLWFAAWHSQCWLGFPLVHGLTLTILNLLPIGSGPGAQNLEFYSDCLPACRSQLYIPVNFEFVSDCHRHCAHNFELVSYCISALHSQLYIVHSCPLFQIAFQPGAHNFTFLSHCFRLLHVRALTICAACFESHLCQRTRMSSYARTLSHSSIFLSRWVNYDEILVFSS